MTTASPKLRQVQLKFRISASADDAWAALHSPAVLTALYAPVIVVEPLTRDRIAIARQRVLALAQQRKRR